MDTTPTTTPIPVRPRRRPRDRRPASSLALAIDVGRAGGPASWLARHHLTAPYLAAGERIDIGPRSLYLDCRGSGLPTVILEAGSGSDSGTWSAVHDALAATTRTCAYDRTGRGRSDPRPRHTLADAAADLRAVLDAAGETGPYIVVGHSLGGAYGRVFAGTDRAEMAGLVLVDAFNPDLESTWIHPLLGTLRGEYQTRLDGLRAHVSQVDGLDWVASEAQLRASCAGGPADRGPRRSALRAAPRRGDQRAHRRRVAEPRSSRSHRAMSRTRRRGAPVTTSRSTARTSSSRPPDA